MTNSDGITEHIRAREEEHFRQKDRELIEKLRRLDADAKMRSRLEQETGIHDPAMLEELATLGFTPDTLPLLPIIPVLQVAWAKAGVSTAERTLVITFARASGIMPGSAADHQLHEWLEHRPSEETFHKATRLIRAIVDAPEGGPHHLSADELIEHCDRIAHASGGILGIGRVSAEEKATIAEIAATVKKG